MVDDVKGGEVVSSSDSVGDDAVNKFLDKMGSIAASVGGNPLDKAYDRIASKMFSEEDILWLSNLSPMMVYYVNKHIVVENWFVDWWMNVKVGRKLVPSDRYPFYKKDDIIEYPSDIAARMRAAHWKTVVNICKTTVSVDGAGRKEAKDILGGAKDEIKEDELLNMRYNKERGV